MSEKVWYTVIEIARELNRSPVTVRRWIRSGKIGARRQGFGDRSPWVVSAKTLQVLRKKILR